ncbi:MAG: S8 family serine peptidase [Acidobacteria bacterium]|nr:S8 family serine peptidase [Acidobacteriota bacterium]
MRGSGRWAPFIAGVVLSLTVIPPAPAQPESSKLRGELARVLDAAAPGDRIPVSVVLAEQVDPGTIERLARSAEPRRAIAARLKQHAARTQAPLLAAIAGFERDGLAARVRPLWLSNVIGLDATAATIRALAQRPEVAWINHNPKRPVFVETPRHDGQPDGPTDWGVIKMRAPEVWSQLGLTGKGVVVADIDSGVCYEHPDIVDHVWINPGEDLDGDRVVMDPTDVNGVDDDGNGRIDDLIGWNFEVGSNDPRDTSSGHGSHTAGTVAGDGTQGTQTGVAPDAQIMVVKVGLSLSDEVDVWNGMEYAAENGADLITMSLGWQHSWDPDRTTWRRNSENTIAMGTIMIVAAGNEGGGNEPDNVRTPGDVPKVITVGATDPSDAAAYFTSLGPVTWEDVPGFGDHPYPPGLIKPDVSAPGTDTLSFNFCNGYTTMSGTSMATPHVAGLAALMLEGDPYLTRDEMAAILEETAIDLGTPGKDNTFGSGRVDALAAANEANAKLRYLAHRLDDTGQDRGNGDLALDPGEVATLVVTIRNVDAARTFTGISAFLASETPGLVVLDNHATYPDLAPGASSDPVGPAFAVQVETPCFTDAQLRLDVYDASGRRSRSRFVLRVGSPIPTVLLADDAEQDRGWASGGTAADGRWERGVPKPTLSHGKPANPGEDAGAASTRAWVTGNGGVTANDDDVDGGEAWLTSPALDASAYASLTLSYSRWFFREGLPSYPPAQWYLVEASPDGGASWVEVERLLSAATPWTPASFALGELIPLTGSLRLRVRVADTGSGDAVIEGGLDEVRLAGDKIVCDAWVPPVLAVPPPVGDTLQAARVGDAVKLSWTAPAPGPGQGPATRYDVLGAGAPGAPMSSIGGATQPEWWDAGARLDGEALRLYRVVAENSGGQAAGDLP